MPQILERAPNEASTVEDERMQVMEELQALEDVQSSRGFDCAPSFAPSPTVPARREVEDYRPFGSKRSRNGLQERVEIPLLLRALGLARGGRVLEVGCGRGIALPVLSERLAPDELVGVDVDRRALCDARAQLDANGARAALHVADVRDLPFPRASFDLVIDFGTCYHVGGGHTGRLTALNEIARVLRVGGLFVHETRLAQRLAHPIRSIGRRLPWMAMGMLVPERSAVLWAARRRV